jgi:GntR family transcriptional regulator
MPMPRWPAARSHPPAFSPLYQQIKSLILQSLQAGEWKPGDLIPSELDLAARYKVSQGTVRKAIDELAADNLLVRRQGKGTFVATHAEAAHPVPLPAPAPRPGHLDSEGPAAAPHHECRRLRAPAEITSALGLRGGEPPDAGQPRAVVPRHPHHSGRPVAARRPLQGPDAGNPGPAPGPMYALFETQFGVRMVRAEEKSRPWRHRRSGGATRRAEAGFPLLSVERVAYTYNDVPMELRRGLYRTDRHHYRNELS